MKGAISAHAASLTTGSTLHDSVPRHEFIDMPLPDMLWATLELLYASVYASRASLEHDGDVNAESPARAWIERTQGKITSLLLFRREGAVVQVLNEVIHLTAEVVHRFARAVFDDDPDAHFVKLHAIVLERAPDSPRLWASNFSEDYVLPLPHDHDSWMAGLSRQTREKLRYHLRRSFRREPGLGFRSARAAGITESEVRAVLRLNRERMKIKGKAYGMNPAQEAQLCAQLQVAGLMFLLTINDTICAGLLCTVTGTDVYMHVIAHDPRYDDLRPGLLCCCLGIRESISAGAARFHFLWGHYDYKRKLGARPVPLSRVLVPRSAWRCLRHPLLSGDWMLQAVRDALRRWRQALRTGGSAC